MNIRSLVLAAVFLSTLLLKTSFAGVVYQNFETDNGLPVNISPVGAASVSVVDRTEAVYAGERAVKSSSTSYWTGVGVMARNTGFLDIKQTNNDRLTFQVFAKPVRLCYIFGCSAGTDNTVGVTFYDNGTYKTTGFEVWTTQTANFSKWSKLKILFSQLPSNFNLRQVTKIEFKHYSPGNYYIDDIHAVREDRVYQSFEKSERSGSSDSEYGWKWNAGDTALVAGSPEPVYSGSGAWKLTTALNWSGTGIQAQDKKLITVNGVNDQSFWHVDLMPENSDRLTFMVYALPTNGMDNNISVQFYDNGAHATDATKVAVWPKFAAVTGQWTRVTVLYSDVKKQAPDFNFKDINKIQFQSYWPGTFYIDDIKASAFVPYIAQSTTTGAINWSDVGGTNRKYRLQESPTGKDGTWKTVYLGTAKTFVKGNISANFFRVRWEEDKLDINTVPYISPWSDVFEFIPLTCALSFPHMQIGKIYWYNRTQATAFELQSATSKLGPWTTIYQGPLLAAPIVAIKAKWYRVRAIQQSGTSIIGLTPWSRPQSYNPGIGFVKAAGTVLKDNDGTGNTLILNGVNFGGGLVNEPWMTGLGQGDSPALEDDWSLRNKLAERFTPTEAKTLLSTFQNAYFNSYDLDYLLKLGVNLVRLPFYYRNLQDDNGAWILNSAGQIDFTPLDRLVTALSERGIYVVLDLHGAPGLQSADANTGRKGFNKLFAPDGEVYRQRTINLWTEVARHFKNNTWVLGYDLLNEPVGAAPNNVQLADMYDRIYKAIRAVDVNHLIMMEGIWYTDTATNKEVVDWATLPVPSVRGWSNVLYQFHFYHWDYVDANGVKQKADENPASHMAFIDAKVDAARTAQPLYNVPVMVGEFYGFGIKSIWDYYISRFNAEKWSWTSWSYKYHDSPQNWGLFNHYRYTSALPSIQNDSYSTLISKFGAYTTHFYHTPNVALQNIFIASTRSLQLFPSTLPSIAQLSALYLEPGQELVITGKNFGSLDGVSTVFFRGVAMPIAAWTDTMIKVNLPGNLTPNYGTVRVKTNKGTSDAADLIVVAHDPTLDPVTINSTGSQLPDLFMDTFERCNGRPLGTHGCI